jgi:23S rRNA (cytosine1962-C5)-methyltransferase
MLLETLNQFKDFELIDTGDGFRLERWGKFILQRPDPQIIWPKHLPESEWDKADAVYAKGGWAMRSQLPKSWLVAWDDISLIARLSPFKHTGIFAEQAVNWEWTRSKAGNKKLKILNLFAYTGGATIALAKQGHFVTHVDASKPSISWAKENHFENKLPADSVRWILDDAAKFAAKELKRGQQYDGIIMDPPAFGHGPTGTTWKFNEHLPKLLQNAVQLLSPNARFLLINGYATNSSAIALNNILEDTIGDRGGTIDFGELCLKQKDQRLISTGIFARWSK